MMKHLEKSLERLRVKPRFGFRMMLKMRLYLRMWQMSGVGLKFATSLAVLTIFVAGIFGTGFFGTGFFQGAPGYAYFVEEAYSGLEELSGLFEEKVAERSFIAVARADSGIDEERLRFLTGRIVLLSELALEAADDIEEPNQLSVALMELSLLQKNQIQIFGRAAERVFADNTLLILSNAIEATFQNSVEVQSAVLQVGGAQDSSRKSVIVDFKLKLIAAEDASKLVRIPSDESITEVQKSLSRAADPFNIEDEQKKAENDLKRIVFAVEENSSAGALSRRYLKAISEMEAQNSIKAKVLFNSVERESRYLAMAAGEELALPAVTEPAGVPETAPGNELRVDDDVNFSGGTSESVTELAIPVPNSAARAPKSPIVTKIPSRSEEDAIDQALTVEEQVELVGKLLKSKEPAVSESVNTEGGAGPKAITEPIYAEKDVQLEDKIKLFKEEKKLERIEEQQIQIDEEKKTLEEEARKKSEEQLRNEQERQARLLEQQSLEAEQQRIAQEKRQIEVEQQKIAQEQAKPEVEQQGIAQEQAKFEAQQQEAEKKRLEEDHLRKEAEERAIAEQLVRELEDQQRIEADRQRLEEEKRLLEEERLRQEAEQQRIREELRRQEEEKERIRQELLKKQEEEKERTRQELIEKNDRANSEPGQTAAKVLVSESSAGTGTSTGSLLPRR